MNRYRLAVLALSLLSSTICLADKIDVSHAVVPVAQVKDMNCWVAATTMLVSWKRQASISMDGVVKEAGEPYKTFFDTNSGIKPDDEAKFYKKLGLQTIKQQNLTVQAWADLLKAHGPISVTVDAKPGKGFIHALVVTSMKGDGSSDKTTITYNDPADGKSHSLPFGSFLKLYEGSANWPLQIIYF